MIIFLLISSLLTVAVAQQASLSCIYFVYFGNTYGCDLTIINPNGLNNFTEIFGIHLVGFSNADVAILYKTDGGSPNVPAIICDTFPNLNRIELYNTGLTEIGDSDFDGCSQVIELGFAANRISSITANAFVNLPNITSLDLNLNSLTTLPENVFASQRNLKTLDLNSNLFEDIPGGLFRPLESLESLYLGHANLNAINSQWFTANEHLEFLYLASNDITVAPDSFLGLERLITLNIAYNGINEIPTEAFVHLQNLQFLYLYGNNFSEIQPDSFRGLEELVSLDLSENPIDTVHNGAFRGLLNLTSLALSYCHLRELRFSSFEGLENLNILSLNFNRIEELVQGLFAPMPNLAYIGLWNNRLKTLRRSTFGTLTSLLDLDLEANVINGIDRAIIDDAVNLDTLFLGGNLCASGYFNDFFIARERYLPILDRCFRNMRYIIDAITERDAEFSFFEVWGPTPGIALRVVTDNEVQISLTAFNFIWSPVIEILIGTANNTRSEIRINQETNVATVPTPNIITPDQWNDFRITWANQVILVYRGNNSFPFISFTMQDLFPVNFYGLRAVETRASWIVQPFDW